MGFDDPELVGETVDVLVTEDDEVPVRVPFTEGVIEGDPVPVLLTVPVPEVVPDLLPELETVVVPDIVTLTSELWDGKGDAEELLEL